VPGTPWENTYCSGCSLPVILRSGLMMLANRTVSGACPRCGRNIAGVGLEWREPVPQEQESRSSL